MTYEIRENQNYTFETTEDDYRRKWIERAYGSGEVLIIPEDIYGVTTDAFNACDEAKRIWVPARVKVIANDAFSCFRNDVTVYCEAKEQPGGWFNKETGMTTTGFGADMSFEVLVNSWLGSYVYKCDSDDNISFINRDTAKVVWGSALEDLI